MLHNKTFPKDFAHAIQLHNAFMVLYFRQKASAIIFKKVLRILLLFKYNSPILLRNGLFQQIYYTFVSGNV